MILSLEGAGIKILFYKKNSKYLWKKREKTACDVCICIPSIIKKHSKLGGYILELLSGLFGLKIWYWSAPNDVLISFGLLNLSHNVLVSSSFSSVSRSWRCRTSADNEFWWNIESTITVASILSEKKGRNTICSYC